MCGTPYARRTFVQNIALSPNPIHPILHQPLMGTGMPLTPTLMLLRPFPTLGGRGQNMA